MFDIGILAGSGPEAGIDLWQAVLAEWRRRLGERYRGDQDAPAVLVRSDPRLGASMDMEGTHDRVRPIVRDHAAVLDPSCATWAIACNTLNAVAPDVERDGHAAHLLTFTGVLERFLDQHDGETAEAPVLLAARPVASLGPRSPYRHVADRLRPLSVELIDELHGVIVDVKRVGPPWTGLPERLAFICERSGGERFVLACTELPLLANASAERFPAEQFVDVTRLVAAALVDAALDARGADT